MTPEEKREKQREYDRKRWRQQEHRDRYKARTSRPEVRNRIRECARKRRAANIEHYREQERKQYYAHRKEISARNKARLRNDPAYRKRLHERLKKWRLANIDNIRRRYRAYDEKNKEQRRAYRLRPEVKERTRIRTLAWASRPEVKERRRELAQQYREKNRTKLRQQARNHYLKNKVKIHNRTYVMNKMRTLALRVLRSNPAVYELIKQEVMRHET